MEDFDFIGPNDKPALLAITTPAALQAVRPVVAGLGYKVHIATDHTQFEGHYNQVNYQVVVIEENFCGSTLLENSSLQTIQALPMAHRRYATFFLIGPTVESLNTLQAFSQSVHCVLNFSALPMLGEVVKKTIAENDLFLTTFREAQRRVYMGSN